MAAFREPTKDHFVDVTVVVAWLVVIASIVIGYRSMLPPEPVPATAPLTEFSADRAMDHLREIARQPHPMGTPAIAEVRGYIVAQLDQLGLDVDLQVDRVPDYYGDSLVDIVNIVATVPGTESTGSVALVAHYDTVPATPGANDNSAAVSALIETGRALLAGSPLRNDVVLVFTDGEEPAPRFGATVFAAKNPLFDDIRFVVNFEASGGSGASLLAEVSGPERWILGELTHIDGNLAAFSFVTETTQLVGELGTDFDIFRDAGVAGVHLAYMHGSPIYHTADDDIGSVNLGSLQHHGDQALGIAKRIGASDLATPHPHDGVVFFSVKPLVISYSSSLALPLVLLLIALYVAWIRRKGSGAPAPSLRGSGWVVAAGFAATLVGTALWFVVVAARPTPRTAEAYVYLVGLLAIGTNVARYVASRAKRPQHHGDIILIWVLLATVTALTAPGFSYLFVWPALAVTVALMFDEVTSSAGQIGRLAAITLPTLVLLTPAIDFFFQFAQPRPGNPGSQILAVIVLPLLLGLLTAGLVGAVWPSTWRRGGVLSRRG